MPAAPIRRFAVAAAALLAGCAAAPTGIAPPPASAVPDLRVARAADPDNPTVAWRLAAALRAADQPGEARTVLEASLADHPEHSASLHLLGAVREEIGDDPGAAEAYERFLATSNADAFRVAVEARLAEVRRRILEAEIRAALRDEARLAATPPEARTVAVFPFTYRGAAPEVAPLGRALTHMVVTDLAATDRLTVLERLQVQLLADEIALTDEGLTDLDTGVRGGRLLGAERVVQGQIGGDDAQVSLSAGVLASSADSLAVRRVEAEDALDRFFELEAQLVLGLFDAMGIELTAAERERVGRRPTESLEALLAFGLGLEAQDEGRYAEAQEHFRRAVELDPDFDYAADALDTASRLETATGQDPEVFAGLGGNLLRPTPEELWLERRATYRGIETILPTLGGRDPWSEVLDDEGLAPSAGTVIIVLPRPGGGDR